MSFLYWMRYGFLLVMAVALAVLIYVHVKTIRSR